MIIFLEIWILSKISEHLIILIKISKNWLDFMSFPNTQILSRPRKMVSQTFLDHLHRKFQHNLILPSHKLNFARKHIISSFPKITPAKPE